MKAEEAVNLAIKNKPVHEQHVKLEAIAAVYEKIREAVARGEGSIRGGWWLSELGFSQAVAELRKDGYYVREAYNGAPDYVVAWGKEDVERYKQGDEYERKLAEQRREPQPKKWWQF